MTRWRRAAVPRLVRPAGPVITFGAVIIHAVHGTWPYGPPTWRGRRRTREEWTGTGRPWFEGESAFVTAVTGERSLTWLPFVWSGDNTFTARQEAIDRFYTHLCTSLEASAGSHAIVAHSHGGTVALAAVARLRAEQQARIAGIVTMGTPFTTLKYATSSAAAVVQGALEFAGALAPVIVATCAAIVWALGSPRLFLHTLALAAIAWLVFLATVPRVLPRLMMWRSGPRPYAFDLFGDLGATRTPLVALRASGDEAALAIASAQALQLAARAALRMFPLSVTHDEIRVRAWFRTTCYALFAAAFVAALARVTARNRDLLPGLAQLDPAAAGLAAMAIMAAFFDAAVRLLMVVVFGLAGGTALLAALAVASAVALARATGRESWDLIAQVECEPVPSGVRAVVETLALDTAEERQIAGTGAMRHSFHELPTARRRVARAITDWLAPAGDEERALADGGRARDLVFDRWAERHRDVLRAGGLDARQQAQRLVSSALAAAGPVAAFQLIHRLRPLLPENDRAALDSLASDANYEEIQGDLARVTQQLEEL